LKEDKGLAFITADFCLISRDDADDKGLAVYGQGRVYDHIFTELRNRTLDLRMKFSGVVVVWILHFAPYDCGFLLRLADFQNIIDAARSMGVFVSICGHTHEPLRHSGGGHIVYCAGSAGCVDSEENSFLHVLHFDIEEECRVSRETHEWNADDGEFKFKERD
jgi:hypothetical protein